MWYVSDHYTLATCLVTAASLIANVTCVAVIYSLLQTCIQIKSVPRLVCYFVIPLLISVFVFS